MDLVTLRVHLDLGSEGFLCTHREFSEH